MEIIDRITSWRYLTPLKAGKLMVIIGEGVTDDFVSRAIPPRMQVVKFYLKEIKKDGKQDTVHIALPDNSIGKAIILGETAIGFKDDLFRELYRVLDIGAGVCFFVSQRMQVFSYRRLLKIYGFESIRIYGIFPNFNYPRWIIPLRTKYFISSTKGIFKPVKLIKKIYWKLVVPFSYVGLHHYIFRNIFIVAEKESQANIVDIVKDEGLWTLLYSTLKQKKLEMALLNRPQKYYQKTNAQVMNLEGDIVAYVKIGDTPQVKALLENEYNVLRILRQLDIRSADLPYVMCFDKKEQATIMVQRAEPSLKAGPMDISNEHILFLTEIFNKTAKIYRFEESPLFFNMQENFKNLKDKIENKWRNLLMLTFERICQKFRGEKVQFGLTHWDFTTWNTCRNGKGRLVVFDWEVAVLKDAPLIDFYNFIINTEGLIASKKGDEILSRLLNERHHYFELINQYKNALDHAVFFDLIGFLLVYLYKASIFNLRLEIHQKQIGFDNGRRVQLLGILQTMLEEILKIG